MGIRPEVAYAQAAKETAFGRFGGVVTRDHHNWCGLKTTQGGSNSDPYAHAKFPDDEVGVLAHLQHLALYAGVEVTGRIVDPRHFSSIEGTAPTVEALGGKWAPAADYGQSIVRDYLAGLLSTKVSTPPVDRPVEHWAQKDHDELRAAGYLLDDHTGTLDEPASKGIVFALANRLRKEIENRPPAEPEQPQEPTEPQEPEEPEQPTDPEPEPEQPQNYPPCYLGIPGVPCIREDGTIDWKGQEPAPGYEEPGPQPQPDLPTWEETIERVKDAAVMVWGTGYGSGFVYRGKYVITARHNIDESDRQDEHPGFFDNIRVWFRDGRRDGKAKLVGVHPEADLAVYELTNYTDEPSLPLYEGPLQIGMEIGVVGHQQGIDWADKRGMITELSSEYRPWAFRHVTEPDTEKGNSGGPVFDQWGNVCGIHIGYGGCATNLTLFRDWIAERATR
ncbi:MAG: trypsin-like peptidase domain-containing protein, partial [Brevibacillus sp.]|nr:trypsin-like peptidase domain-containing protein [Brevibacillus sp.]